LGAEELAGAKKALGWPYGPFEVPDNIVTAWRKVGTRGAGARAEWESRLKRDPQRDAFAAAMNNGNIDAAIGALGMHAAEMAADKPALATRASSGAAIEAMFQVCPELWGGSADLTGSNNTLVKGTPSFDPDNRSGRYIHYGIREHGM